MEVVGSNSEYEGQLVRTHVPPKTALNKGRLDRVVGLSGPARYSRLPQNFIAEVSKLPVVVALEEKLTSAIKERAGKLDVLSGTEAGEGKFSRVDVTEQGECGCAPPLPSLLSALYFFVFFFSFVVVGLVFSFYLASRPQ